MLKSLRLVLVRTEGPINLGMIARTCGNWGIDDCILVDPQCPIDCDDTRKFANRAIDWLRSRPVVATIDQALEGTAIALATTARSRDGQPPLRPDQVPQWLLQHNIAKSIAQPIALVFGNEKHGLNEEEYRACQGGLTLPMPGSYQSFNLAQAVATGLAMLASVEQQQHQIHSNTAATPLPVDPNAAPPASQDQRRELVTTWVTAADTIEHLTGVEAGKRAGWQRKLETWLMQTPMNREEGNAMRAFLATLLKNVDRASGNKNQQKSDTNT